MSKWSDQDNILDVTSVSFYKGEWFANYWEKLDICGTPDGCAPISSISRQKKISSKKAVVLIRDKKMTNNSWKASFNIQPGWFVKKNYRTGRYQHMDAWHKSITYFSGLPLRNQENNCWERLKTCPKHKDNPPDRTYTECWVKDKQTPINFTLQPVDLDKLI